MERKHMFMGKKKFLRKIDLITENKDTLLANIFTDSKWRYVYGKQIQSYGEKQLSMKKITSLWKIKVCSWKIEHLFWVNGLAWDLGGAGRNQYPDASGWPDGLVCAGFGLLGSRKSWVLWTLWYSQRLRTMPAFIYSDALPQAGLAVRWHAWQLFSSNFRIIADQCHCRCHCPHKIVIFIFLILPILSF